MIGRGFFVVGIAAAPAQVTKEPPLPHSDASLCCSVTVCSVMSRPSRVGRCRASARQRHLGYVTRRTRISRASWDAQCRVTRIDITTGQTQVAGRRQNPVSC